MSEVEQTVERERLAILDATDPKVAIAAFDKWEFARGVLHSMRLEQVNKKYTPTVMRGMIAEEFRAQIEYARREQDKEYAKNDDLRSKGIPFGERRKLIDRERIALMERQEKRLHAEYAAFRPVPIEEWFTEDDYDFAARHGMPLVIRLNFAATYQVPHTNNHG